MSEMSPNRAGDHLPASRLERWLGKKPPEWTVEDLIGVVKDRRIRLVSLMHTGNGGILKTLDFAPGSLSHLRDVLEGGERADGSSVLPHSGLRAGASDIILRPRVAGAFLDPFSPEPTLAVLCGHLGRDGEPLPESPDTIVRRAWSRLEREQGLDLRALGEVEYFLGKRAEESDVPGKAERGYHGTAPFVFGQDLRRRAAAALAEIGVPVKYAHSEVGYVEPDDSAGIVWEQHEIELNLAKLPEAADAISLTRWVLMNLARSSKMQISFLPLVRVGHAGSGMHVHFTPFSEGRHRAGRDEDGRLSEPTKWVIAALVRLGGALMAFGNRHESSFVRTAQGKEAPRSVTWGEFDRSALIRLPVVVRRRDGAEVSPPTVEFRLPDGTADPHLLLAGVAQAVSDAAARGDADRILAATASKRARVQPDEAAPLPRNFGEVRRELSRHRDVLTAGGVFPGEVLDRAIR